MTAVLIFLSYLYLLIPFIIFVLGWIKTVYAVPVVIASFCIIYFLYKDSTTYTDNIKISNKAVWTVILIICVWVLVLGVVGIFPQSPDYAEVEEVKHWKHLIH